MLTQDCPPLRTAADLSWAITKSPYRRTIAAGFIYRGLASPVDDYYEIKEI
jgi:hypothetical protein